MDQGRECIESDSQDESEWILNKEQNADREPPSDEALRPYPRHK